MTVPEDSDPGVRAQTSDVEPIGYPAQRPWRLPSSTEVALNSLGQAWARSREAIEAIRQALQRAQLPACLRVVAVSGSLGRMEFGRHSDVDLIMITAPENSSAQRLEAGRVVWSALEPLAFRLPLTDGIFSTPIDESLIASRDSLGEIDEPKAVFGIRMQMLLDSQPVFGDGRFDLLLERILQRYQPGDEVDSFGNALLDELIRYHRALRTIYRWTCRDEPAAWRSRDVKMMHSRLLIYAGLLFLLGEASRRAATDTEWLTRQMHLTPLERLAAFIGDEQERRHVSEILRRYDYFLSVLGSEGFPDLIARDDDGITLRSNQLYRGLLQSGEALSDELYSLLLLRLPRWSAEFRKKIVFGC